MEHVVAGRASRLAQHDLRAPARSVLREQAADVLVAAPIAAGADQDRRDVLELGLDAERGGQLAAQAQAVGIGVLLGHQDAQDICRAEGAHAERRHHARINAAREADHDALAAQAFEDLRAQTAGNALGLRGGVDGEGKRLAARVHAATSSLRAILPFSLFGSWPRNSTSDGTMNSSSRAAQWRMTSRSVRPSSAATIALIAMPRSGSGTPITAASRIPASS